MDDELKNKKYGFVGAGNMAWAIFQKLLKSGIPSQNISASAPSMRNLERWKSAGAKTCHDNGVIVKNSEIIFLAMKPQHFFSERGTWTDTKQDYGLFVSVMAGVTIGVLESTLEKLLARSSKSSIKRIVRVMPNTPLFVGYGCSVLCEGDDAVDGDLATVKKLLSGDGSLAEEVPEHMMDAAGAVAGCGPAYMYQMLEAMADGAVKQGVPRALASTLAAQTMMGAAQMALQTGKNPGLLKDEVCSPGGTTIAGLYALKKAPNFSVAVMDAVECATLRSRELGNSMIPKPK